MVISLSAAWRLAFTIALCAAIVVSAGARAPRRSASRPELKRLVVCALMLYGVGGVASVTHHPLLSGFVYGAGVTVCALAAWLSRGRDQEDPPDHEDPVDAQPPSPPDGAPSLDWATFERDFRDYERGRREPSQTA